MQPSVCFAYILSPFVLLKHRLVLLTAGQTAAHSKHQKISHLEDCISRCKGFWKWNKVLSVNCVQEQRMPRNATLGSGAHFSGLLLKVQILASRCNPTTRALCTERRRTQAGLTHSSKCLIFLANIQHGPKHWQERDTSLRYSGFSFETLFELNGAAFLGLVKPAV